MIKECKEEYEQRFNWYIMKLINKTYKNYLKRQKKFFMNYSLNGYEEIEGDNDVLFEEEIIPQKLEKIMNNKRMYYAIEPLTDNEKLVFFLYFILEKTTEEIARIMGYKDRSSIKRVCNKAIKKIKNNFLNMEVDSDD